MAANKRTRLELERDRKIVTELYLARVPQIEIANQLQKMTNATYYLSQQQISFDIKRIEKQFREERTIDITAHKNRILAEIETLKITYWRAWRKSCEERKKLMAKTEGMSKTPSERRVIQEEMLGDPRFLQGVRDCIERECKLLGLDEPDKLQIQDLVTDFIMIPPDEEKN